MRPNPRTELASRTATATQPAGPATGEFQIGPDQEGDLRHLRPYFLVPIDCQAKRSKNVFVRWIKWLVPNDDWQSRISAHPVHDRICRWIPEYEQQQRGTLLYTDLYRPTAFVRRLRLPKDQMHPTTRYINDLLSEETRHLLERFHGAVPPRLHASLVSDLNRLLGRPDFFDARRFTGVSLLRISGSEQRQLGKALDGPRLRRLNRKLLHAAFPEEISPAKERITDVFIMSHGWHRNFYSAVAAYDRLISRMLTLLHSGRLQAPATFMPLFLTIHWHSDPGEDEWVDRMGRRHKASFLDNVEKVFERPISVFERQKSPPLRFNNVFENIFQLFAQMSAPGPRALSNPRFASAAKELSEALKPFRLKNAPEATEAHKVATVWTCYHEAQSKRVLLDQSQTPQSGFVGFLQALRNAARLLFGTLRFLNPILLMIAIIAVLLLCGWFVTQRGATHTEVMRGLVSALLALFLYSHVVFFLKRNINKLNQHGDNYAKLETVFAWGCLQLLYTIGLFSLLTVSYFFGSVVRHFLLFDERLGSPDTSISEADTSGWRFSRIFRANVRYRLAQLARLPVSWFKNSIPKDSRLNVLADSIESYVAFWEMQVRGTETGRRTADFVTELFMDQRVSAHLGRARIHFLGHSFGGLVVANAVRHLALDKAVAPSWKQRKIHTLCLLQGALGTDWFAKEKRLMKIIDGSLASIYSYYDTANGFYYPFANGGRRSAGYVGIGKVDRSTTHHRLPLNRWYKLNDAWLRALSEAGVPGEVVSKIADLSDCLMTDERKFDRQLRRRLSARQFARYAETIKESAMQSDEGLFASLTEPPELQRLLKERNPQSDRPWVVSLDASRLIYDGSVAMGGGHNDIFKDDIIHLAWAVTRLGQM